MKKFKNLWLGLAVAVAMVGLATASSASIDLSDASASGVHYDWWGDMGELSLVGAPGSTYAVYDIDGNAVDGGVLDAPHVSFVVGNAGVGPDGAVIYVVVNGDIVAVTDPDWEWN